MFHTSFEEHFFCRSIKRTNSVGTILYIHGLGESGLCFESLILDERLGAWSHLVLDLAGYGKSLWPEQPQLLEHHADRLASWLQRQTIDPVILLGHSMGGVIGLILCEKYPELVQGFLNVEGNISLEDCTFSSKAASYSIEDFQAYGFDAMRESIYADGLNDAALRGYYASLRLCQPLTYYTNSQELVELSGTTTLASRLGALPIPQLYLLGNPRGTGERSRSMLNAAGVEWRAIEAAGHWPFLDQPRVFMDEMVSFLNQLHS